MTPRSLLLLVVPLLLSPKTSVAQSQPVAAPVVRVGEAERDQARALYDEAIQYGKKGEYRKAKASLSAAWSLIKTWEIAVNLGSAEMRLGRYRDAAEHLTWGIRDGSAKEGESYAPLVKARSLLAEAMTHVGQVKLHSDSPGASILVDEEVVGRAPLTDPLYLDPGEHVITALPANPELVSLKLDVRVQPGDSLERYLRFTPSPQKTAEEPDPVLEKTASSGGSFFEARTLVPVTLGGLTAVSAGVALAFTIKASAANSAATDWALRTGGNCDVPSSACAGLEDARDRRNDANRIANVAWVSAGTLGAATLITTFFWPKAASSTSRAGLRVVPRTGDDMRGVLVTGVFE